MTRTRTRAPHSDTRQQTLVLAAPLRDLPPTRAELSQYLASKVWQWLDGDTAGVLVWLQRVGCTITTRSDGCWTLRGLAGMTTALYPGLDPMAVASSIGALIGGQLWPLAFPDLLPTVNRTWQARSKSALRKEAT